MAKINVLICDDVQDDGIGLELAIKAAGVGANCRRFEKGADALSHFKAGSKVDACFLDIVMPEMNGVELARQIRKTEAGGETMCEIVFLSSSNEFASESFEVRAFSYLLKPPDPQKVANVLREIIAGKKAADVSGIPVSTKTLTKFLYFREVSFIEVINYKVYFHLVDGSEIALVSTLGAILPRILEDKRFAQCHRSFVVNMNDVNKIRDNSVLMYSGKQVPISRTYASFCDKYIEYILTIGRVGINRKKCLHSKRRALDGV